MEKRWIRIKLATQLLELFEGSRVIPTYPVSTSAKGAGERIGSGQTPRGLYEVSELIGDGAPAGAVFVGRSPTGEVFTPELQAANPDRDWFLPGRLSSPRAGGTPPAPTSWRSDRRDRRSCAVRAGNVSRRRSRLIWKIHLHPRHARRRADWRASLPRVYRNADVIALFDVIQAGMPVRIDE